MPGHYGSKKPASKKSGKKAMAKKKKPSMPFKRR